jgi:hypothetical protein
MDKFEKVTIVSLDEELPIFITSKYNPQTLSFTKQVSWSANNSGSKTDYPSLQFCSGNAIKLSIELFFDKYEEGGDVRPEILTLMQFVHVCPAIDSERGGRPPKVQLIWGGKSGGNALARASSGIDPLGIGKPFQGVVESVKTDYTMFLENGTPCRASVKVDLIQADAIEEGSGSDAAPPAKPSSEPNPVVAYNASPDNRDDVHESYEQNGGLKI